jgi:hypothetical protein
MPAPLVGAAAIAAAKAIAKKVATDAAKKAAAKAVAKKVAQKTTSGPKFTDYGLRRATNSLTKAEKLAEHKWRMKNDLDYKNQIAIQKAATKKAALAKQTKPKEK